MDEEVTVGIHLLAVTVRVRGTPWRRKEQTGAHLLSRMICHCT